MCLHLDSRAMAAIRTSLANWPGQAPEGERMCRHVDQDNVQTSSTQEPPSQQKYSAEHGLPILVQQLPKPSHPVSPDGDSQ